MEYLFDGSDVEMFPKVEIFNKFEEETGFGLISLGLLFIKRVEFELFWFGVDVNWLFELASILLDILWFRFAEIFTNSLDFSNKLFLFCLFCLLFIFGVFGIMARTWIPMFENVNVNISSL